MLSARGRGPRDGDSARAQGARAWWGRVAATAAASGATRPILTSLALGRVPRLSAPRAERSAASLCPEAGGAGAAPRGTRPADQCARSPGGRGDPPGSRVLCWWCASVCQSVLGRAAPGTRLPGTPVKAKLLAVQWLRVWHTTLLKTPYIPPGKQSDLPSGPPPSPHPRPPPPPPPPCRPPLPRFSLPRFILFIALSSFISFSLFTHFPRPPCPGLPSILPLPPPPPLSPLYLISIKWF